MRSPRPPCAKRAGVMPSWLALIGAAGGAEPGCVDGIGDTFAMLECATQPAGAQCTLVLHGADPISRLKRRCTVKGLRATTRPSSSSATGRSRCASMWARTLSEEVADAVVEGRQRRQGRKPARLGGGGGREEAHVLAQRPAAGACRTAEDAGGRDTVNETCAGIARGELLPGGIGVEGQSFCHEDIAQWVDGGELCCCGRSCGRSCGHGFHDLPWPFFRLSESCQQFRIPEAGP